MGISMRSAQLTPLTTVISTSEEPTSLEPRWRLPDIVLRGRPISTNRYKIKYLLTDRSGRITPRSADSPPATAWMQQACATALEAVLSRAAGVPHPREWPRPLRLSVYVRDGRIDLDNCLKVPIDGIKGALGVDDQAYEYGRICREAGPRGLRIVVESAQLTTSSTSSTSDGAAPQQHAQRARHGGYASPDTKKPASSARASRIRSTGSRSDA